MKNCLLIQSVLNRLFRLHGLLLLSVILCSLFFLQAKRTFLILNIKNIFLSSYVMNYHTTDSAEGLKMWGKGRQSVTVPNDSYRFELIYP